MNILSELNHYFSFLETTLNSGFINEFLACDIKQLHLYHFTLGKQMRTELFHNKNSLYKILSASGIKQKDDMSQLTIVLFYLYLKGKEI